MGLTAYDFFGFESASDYGKALASVPKSASQRVFMRQSAGDQLNNTVAKPIGAANHAETRCFGLAGPTERDD